jgi:ABC-type uncharacterized transport system YnjBCD substrate-binding protein
MKKASTPKKSPAKKADKSKDSGELRKPTKLKPLKEKEKKNWKNNLEGEEDEDFNLEEDDLKLDDSFDDDDDEFFDDDNF